jgi:hypothetical protein
MGGNDPTAEAGNYFCDDLPFPRAAGEGCGGFAFFAFSSISLSSTTRARASSESRIFSGIDLLARGSTSASCRAHAVRAGSDLEGAFGCLNSLLAF